MQEGQGGEIIDFGVPEPPLSTSPPATHKVDDATSETLVALNAINKVPYPLASFLLLSFSFLSMSLSLSHTHQDSQKRKGRMRG